MAASLPSRVNEFRPAVGGGQMGLQRHVTHDRLMAHPQQPKCVVNDTYDSQQRTPAAKFVVNDETAALKRG
jgi:hypothetical protein